MTDDERRRYDAELEQIRATTAQLQAQIANLAASTDKIQLEKALYPMVVGAGMFAGMAGVIIAFIRVFV